MLQTKVIYDLVSAVCHTALTCPSVFLVLILYVCPNLMASWYLSQKGRMCNYDLWYAVGRLSLAYWCTVYVARPGIFFWLLTCLHPHHSIGSGLTTYKTGSTYDEKLGSGKRIMSYFTDIAFWYTPSHWMAAWRRWPAHLLGCTQLQTGEPGSWMSWSEVA